MDEDEVLQNSYEYLTEKVRGEDDMVQRIPMSKTGHKRLKKELDQLERVERFVVIKSIAVARDHGDLKENA